MAERVEVRKYKWPDRLIDTAVERVLGTDTYGVWHGAASGEGGRGADGVTWRLVHSVVICHPHNGWWIAGFDSPGPIGYDLDRDGVTTRFDARPREIYVHIAMPAERKGGVLTWMDLELDVLRNLDGSVVVVDEDEFEAIDYPPDVAVSARAACDEVARMLRERAEPFDSVGRAWLERFMSGEFDR